MVLIASIECNGSHIYAPLATFGHRTPSKFNAIAVRAHPFTAATHIRNLHQMKGNIALVQRGECSFAAKAKHVQKAGAIAMILINSNEELVRMGEAFEHEGDKITIPVIMVGKEFGSKFLHPVKVAIVLKNEEIAQSIGVSRNLLFFPPINFN